MGSSRYFELAELLYAYEGAVRARLVMEQQAQSGPPTLQQAQRPVIEDVSLLAAMTDHPGFPGIEYVGG